jgi:hypothetical protein
VNESNGTPKTKVAQNFMKYNVMQKIKNFIEKSLSVLLFPKLDSFRAGVVNISKIFNFYQYK